MIYTRVTLNDEIEIKVPLYGDQIFCHCPDCGTEVQIDEELLCNILQDGDLASSAVFCDPCGMKYRNDPDAPPNGKINVTNLSHYTPKGKRK